MTNPDREELVKLADRLAAMPTFKMPTVVTVPGVACNARERDLIATALRRLASSDGGVKVRGLEWGPGTTGSHYGALSVFGDYSVWTYHNAGKWFWQNSRRDYGQADTLDAAKAAAQADYEARIRSALVEVPAVKGEPVALSASERACYLWPDDTEQARACRAAYIDGAKDYTAPPAEAGMREALDQRIKFDDCVDAEPSLRRMIRAYYDRIDDPALAQKYADRFIEALTAPGATTKSDGGECVCSGHQQPNCAHYRMGRCADKPGPSDPSPTRSDVTALTDIAKERQRQREVKGWSLAHDDAHVSGELAMAGACYALASSLNTEHALNTTFTRYWPWGRKWWKPKTPRENLVRAGALIVAEIERIDRLETHEIRRK